jgi:ankyrin repeat protein
MPSTQPKYDLSLIELLLKTGASVDAADAHNGCNALHYAAAVPNGVPVIKLLIRFGARALSQDTDGYIPYDYAVEAGETVRVCVRACVRASMRACVRACVRVRERESERERERQRAT